MPLATCFTGWDIGGVNTKVARVTAVADSARPLRVGTQPLVFNTTVGTPLDPSKIRRAFKALAKRAGLGDDWHPHELRHSNASLLSAAGVPIEQISDLLGHSESRTTERTYRHELASSISHGKAAMEQLFK